MSGSCTWTSGITVTKNITIQGAGYTNTKITRNGTAFTLSQTSTRITGIGFILASGSGQLVIAGGSGWRIDHCQFVNNSGTSIVSIDINGVNVSSSPYGLIDNNDFVEGRIVTSLASNATEARAIWAANHPFGSADTTGLHTIYIEDNTFYKTVSDGGNVIDASAYTGAYVARYNTVTGGTQFHVHSLQDGINRGAKAWRFTGTDLPQHLRLGVQYSSVLEQGLSSTMPSQIIALVLSSTRVPLVLQLQGNVTVLHLGI